MKDSGVAVHFHMLSTVVMESIAVLRGTLVMFQLEPVVKAAKIIALLQKMPAIKKKADVSNGICPDGKSECADGNTCCKLFFQDNGVVVLFHKLFIAVTEYIAVLIHL